MRVEERKDNQGARKGDKDVTRTRTNEAEGKREAERATR